MTSSTDTPPVAEVCLSTKASDAEKSHETTVQKATQNKDGYAAASRLALIMTAILMAMFLVALDRTIIASAVPRIANQFHSLNNISWYAGAYLNTSAAT
ncbi:uncharacterized protein ATNIH1004_008833 [Aspergillus tanneri]|uniref:Major facilitator superfamily (MFS) profile domain-containing protein n=1 Tax=Aspergillus tanneri TaxID=1220188 RepID=A0A5M9MPT4_9EURO|nr:uncharacterized protein ATNIH1004_008833 [Aspergillus tanneri]KAA8644627.1 hypothetical protein ATNIH1004_008833 [Aspergillus tanneri]